MKLVTVATHAERYFPYLKLSVEKYKYELVVLGWGEEWKGFVWRFHLLKDYLNSLKFLRWPHCQAQDLLGLCRKPLLLPYQALCSE